MKQVILIPLWITFFLIVVEMWLIFKNMKKRAHYYLFVNCIALLLYSVGSLIMLFVETEEAFFITFMMSWTGKIGVVVSILFFCISYFESKIPVVIPVVESGLAGITYVAIATTKKTGLFIKDFHLVKEKGLTIAEYEHGPWYTLWLMIVFAVIGTCFVMLLKALLSEKDLQKRKQYIAILIALLIEAAVGFLTKLPIGRYYDFNQLGFSVCVILVLFAIFRNNFMDTESVAKEYVIDELSSGVIALSTNERVSYYNKKAQEVFPEIAKDERGVIAQIENSIQTGEPITIEDKVYHFEERKLVQNTLDENRMYVIIDSTKQYQHLKEVERERQIADTANRAKTEFLARMSHEIRTPLNAVLGMDEMILRESSENTIKEYATDIRTAGRTLLTIINDILDLNKIESGKMEVVPVMYDLTRMVEDISNMIKFRAQDKELAFCVSVSDDIPSKLWGDDVKIRQILVNLLTNAVKYTPRGTIWFRVSLNQIADGENGPEAILHFEVEDTGIGIKPEDMNKLFSEFERIEEERNRNIEGTGLGMPITRKLLALMGAELKVKSVYGKGSVFAFDLSQKIAEGAQADAYDNKTTEHKPKRYTQGNPFFVPNAHVLLVDDNVINRRVFTALLKKTQVRITEADSGYQAVELATAQHFDIIFMDHMMPGMDGIEAMEKIKAVKDGPCADTPIIVLTANAIEGSKEKYLKAGFDGYLSKPIVFEELLGVIADKLPEEKIVPVVAEEETK